MKKIILFIAFFAITNTYSQTIFNLDWMIGVNTSDSSITIEVGDAVKWTLRDNIPHTVTNIAGSSVQSFDSGTISGDGTEYSFTFTVEGLNDYQCNFHPSMNGTITVEDNLSVLDKFVKNLKVYPNPVKSDLTISSLLKVDSYQIYNVLGTLVAEGKGSGNITKASMGGLKSGLYFIKVSSNNLQTTLKIAKK